MIRTRTVIQHLNYRELVGRGILPDLISLLPSYPKVIAVKRYPPFVYANRSFAYFGVLMEYVVRAGFRLHLQQPVELGVDPVTAKIPDLLEPQMIEAIESLSIYETSTNINDIVQSAQILSSIFCAEDPFSRQEIQGYVPTWVNIIRELCQGWNHFAPYLQGTVRYNVEYVQGNLAGHPDIVTDQCILDVKNTTSFSKMSEESFLQVLTYVALARNPSIRYMGFVLPMQREIILFDVSKWDATPFLQILLDETQKLIPSQSDLMQRLVEALVTGEMAIPQTYQVRPIISECRPGGHIPKGKDIAHSLLQFATMYPGRPCQMFLSNTRTGKRDAKTAGQIPRAAEVIRQHHLQFFIHAPYMINLCSNECDEKQDFWLAKPTGNPERDFWQQRILNNELISGVALGARGVVVHTGARKEKSEEEALNIMEHMVRTALPHATEDCKLLLETPCGEGTEITTRIEELGAFFYRFTPDERRKLGVCVDTAHVHAADYDPLEYLEHWERYVSDIPIVLIHFNDSKTPRGSRVDRHARVGTGHIGMNKMMAIAVWSQQRGIPLVQE